MWSVEDIGQFDKRREVEFVMRCDFMCNTQSSKNIGGFYDLPLAWGSDDITCFQLAILGGVVYYPKPLCMWRISDINISKIGNIESRLAAVELYFGWIKDFIGSYEPKVKTECKILNEIRKIIPAVKKRKWNF